MTLGFESSLPMPFASAAEMKKSTAKLGDRWPKNTPLVGATAPRFTLNGRPPAVPAPPAEISGGAGNPGPDVTGLVPTVGLPPKTERPLVTDPAKAKCVPMSRAKEQVAETKSASISTCKVFLSNQ